MLGFTRASRPTKVVLQRSLPRPLLPQRRAANAVSVRIKEAADTAEIGCCSVCSRKQTNKGRAAEELAKTAAATAQQRAAEEIAKSAVTLMVPSKMLLLLMTRIAGCCCRGGARRDRCCRSDVLSCWHLMMTQL